MTVVPGRLGLGFWARLGLTTAAPGPPTSVGAVCWLQAARSAVSAEVVIKRRCIGIVPSVSSSTHANPGRAFCISRLSINHLGSWQKWRRTPTLLSPSHPHTPSNRGHTARDSHDRGSRSDRGIGNRATVGSVAGRAAADAPLGHRGRHHRAANRNGGDNLPPPSETEGGASVCVSPYGGAAPPARLALERAGAPPARGDEPGRPHPSARGNAGRGHAGAAP